MILSGDGILERLRGGDVFVQDTWEESSVKEASYALRIAVDGLMLDGEYYEPGQFLPSDSFELQPGKIAILSTVEQLSMPNDLVGKIGVRLDYAAQGLVSFIGIQVDPGYGRNSENNRLYVRVANLGSKSIHFRYRDPVFTFELHEVRGGFDQRLSTTRQSTWTRMHRSPSDSGHASWTHLTQIEQDIALQGRMLKQQLAKEVADIRQSLQPIIMFGVFLVAVTILGVSMTLILSMRDTPSAEVPGWVTSWGWLLLLTTLSLAGVGTAFLVGVAGMRLCKSRQ